MLRGRGRLSMHAAVSHQAQAKPLVTVVEADEQSRESLRTLLATLDVEVTTYPSAETYLTAKRRPQCLIADMVLPGMSGLDLLRRLRAGGDRLPVILLAEESDVPTAVAAMREGASDFIEKPHADVAILKRVSQLLRRDHRRSGGVSRRS